MHLIQYERTTDLEPVAFQHIPSQAPSGIDMPVR